MVWAVFKPVTLGMFFPAGDYVGFNEGLDAYFSAERREAEVKSLGMEDEFKELQAMGIENSFIKSLVIKKWERNLGPLKDVECPKVLKLTRTPPKLGAMFIFGFPIVSATIKDAIETLEPGVHQFWPMKIELPRNKTWSEQYYGMRIGTFLDSFRPEQSRAQSFIPDVGDFRAIESSDHVKELAFSKEAFAGKHVWREVKLTKPQICMSDALMAALAEQNLSLPTHFLAKEV